MSFLNFSDVINKTLNSMIFIKKLMVGSSVLYGVIKPFEYAVPFIIRFTFLAINGI